MNKSDMLRFVNLPLAFSFLIQAATAFLIFFRIKLPNNDLLFEVHEYNGLALITLAAIHLYLNWGWIRATFLTPKKNQVPSA